MSGEVMSLSLEALGLRPGQLMLPVAPTLGGRQQLQLPIVVSLSWWATCSAAARAPVRGLNLPPLCFTHIKKRGWALAVGNRHHLSSASSITGSGSDLAEHQQHRRRPHDENPHSRLCTYQRYLRSSGLAPMRAAGPHSRALVPRRGASRSAHDSTPTSASGLSP